LEKQQRLLKKVSNLEEKLRKTRRELREVTGQDEEVPPNPASIERSDRRRFVPGTLPSLPSERILLGQLGDPSVAEPTPGLNGTTGHQLVKNDVGTPGYGRTSRTSKITTAKDPPSRKRRSLLTSDSEYCDEQDVTSDFGSRAGGDNGDDGGANTRGLLHAPKRQQPPRKAKLRTGKDALEPDPNPSKGTGHGYLTRRRSSLGLRNATEISAITVTPGLNGNEMIPPVPPLPQKLARSDGKGANEFEWPEGFF
jgi:hypothetical protein